MLSGHFLDKFDLLHGLFDTHHGTYRLAFEPTRPHIMQILAAASHVFAQHKRRGSAWPTSQELISRALNVLHAPCFLAHALGKRAQQDFRRHLAAWYWMMEMLPAHMGCPPPCAMLTTSDQVERLEVHW